MVSLLISGRAAHASVRVIGALLTALALSAWWVQSHRAPAVPTIAFIPQTAGAMLWDVEHFGATVAAQELKCRLYWNAPTSEDDVAGQVLLINRVSRGKYQGIVLAPNHAFAILTPLRRAMIKGLPVVIVSAGLDLPPGGKLSYVVNDDEKMGELAGAEIARLIHGKGPIALVGLTRYTPGVTSRVRGAERFLASRFPEISVVSRLGAAYNASRSEELTGRSVDEHPGLKAVLSFTAGSTRGAHAALRSRSLTGTITLVGCEQDSDLLGYLGKGEIAALLGENTYRMGYEAVRLIFASTEGKPLPVRSVVAPLLITKQNINSAEAISFTSFPR